MVDVLLCFEPMPKYAKAILDSFEDKGLAAKIVSLRELALFTKRRKTAILSKLRAIDPKACFVASRAKLAQFIEPLLDIAFNSGIYSPIKPGAYYCYANEMLRISMLSSFNIKVPRTMFFSQKEQVLQQLNKFSFPVILKAYLHGRKVNSVIASSKEELEKILSGISAENFILREYITDELDYAAVIGDEIFNLKIPLRKDAITPEKLKKAYPAKLSKLEEETALQAANVCSGSVATVTMCKGYVLKVKPTVNLAFFSKKTSKDLFSKFSELFLKVKK